MPQTAHICTCSFVNSAIRVWTVSSFTGVVSHHVKVATTMSVVESLVDVRGQVGFRGWCADGGCGGVRIGLWYGGMTLILFLLEHGASAIVDVACIAYFI